MKDIVRNFFGLIFLVAANILVMSVFIALIIANYLACKVAFDFLGYDGLPLAREAFIGQIIGPFFPEATLAHFYAFVVAVVISMGLFILFNRLFHIWELYKERRHYLSQNDKESAEIILYQIYDDITLIAAILPFLIVALIWDFDLFRYRSVFGALGIEDPVQAPLIVENWANQSKSHGHLFAWALASIGAFGYLGITGVASAGLDFSFRRTTERFMRFLTNLENMFMPGAQQEGSPLCGYDKKRQPVYDQAVPVAYDASGNPVEFYGYDSDGYPVYDSQTPLAYDAEGNPIKSATGPEADPTEGNSTAASSPEHHQHNTRRTSRESSQNHGAAGTNNTHRDETRTSKAGAAASGSSDNSQGSLFIDEEVFQNVGGRRNENNQLKDIIGKSGERISLAEAMADKERYWIDPDSLDIWDRDYRRSLFPGTF